MHSAKEKDKKAPRKSLGEIEVEILCAMDKEENLDLFHRISHCVMVKYEEFDALCKANEIKISRKDLMAILDGQGIAYSLPEVVNAKHGPRRVRRKKRR